MNDNISEKDLSERLGLSRDELRYWRSKGESLPNLVVKEQSNKPEKLKKWLWTPIGVSWLTDQLNDESNSISQEIYEEKKQEEEEVIVVKCNYPNRRFIYVKNDKGEERSVGCKDNRGFRQGVRITIKKDKLGWFVKRNPVFKE